MKVITEWFLNHIFSSVFHSANLSTLKILNQSHNTNCITIPKSIIPRHTMSHGCLLPCILCCMTCEFIQHLLCYFLLHIFQMRPTLYYCTWRPRKGGISSNKRVTFPILPDSFRPKRFTVKKIFVKFMSSFWRLLRLFLSFKLMGWQNSERKLLSLHFDATHFVTFLLDNSSYQSSWHNIERNTLVAHFREKLQGWESVLSKINYVP